jgi:RND family efflux transporter MFP subunit
MPAARIYGGTMCVAQGGISTISAPFAGTLLTTQAELPRPGTVVKKQSVLLRLSPAFAGQRVILTPADRLSLVKAQADLAGSLADAQGQAQSAEAQLLAAQAQLERADRLRREKAGSQQAYETARAAAQKAQADRDAALSRLKVIQNVSLEVERDSVPALEIKAPIDGIVTALDARGGLEVPAGIPLLEITATDPIWVRVPVYVGDLDLLDTRRARVCRIGAHDENETIEAKPVVAAPVANANAASVDLFFELPNPDLRWKPDQRVIVHLPLKRTAEILTVPRSAIVHDIHGGDWVYVRTAPRTYARRRVELRDTIGEVAALSRGPEPGTLVITQGAAEVFGTEFGPGK